MSFLSIVAKLPDFAIFFSQTKVSTKILRQTSGPIWGLDGPITPTFDVAGSIMTPVF